MEKLYVIKIGGNVIDNEPLLNEFLRQFSSIKGTKILVHGGGKIATETGNLLGIESKYHNGRRITDEGTLDLVTMVYGGLINKKIVAQLQSLQCNAIGLTGVDGNLLSATKRVNKEIDFGWVGDTDERRVNIPLIQSFIDQNITLVIAPLTHDVAGHLLNTNADTVASVIACAMSPLFDVQLVFCFEKKGVLYNVNNDEMVIKTISESDFINLKEDKKLHSGILPKIENALNARKKGVTEIIIGKAEDILINISSSGINGTRIV